MQFDLAVSTGPSKIHAGHKNNDTHAFKVNPLHSVKAFSKTDAFILTIYKYFHDAKKAQFALVLKND